MTTKGIDKMKYNLKISKITNHIVFSFGKTLYAETINEIIDYVNEMAKNLQQSTKLNVVIYDEDKKKIATYNYDSGWLMF